MLSMLHEAEKLTVLKAAIVDPNSMSQILSVVRQHIEKKKAFGTQDFKYRFVIESIRQNQVHQGQT